MVYCVAHRMQLAEGTFLPRSLPWLDSAQQLAEGMLARAKEAGWGSPESRVSLLISFTHAMLKRSDLQASHGKDWSNGASVVHGIINDLVDERLEPVHATLLVIMCKEP